MQSRVGWEFGGRVPKEVCQTTQSLENTSLTSLQFLLSLATKTNSKPLPAVPEVFGVRLPPAKHCLTAVDFDLVPNKPPPAALTANSDDSDEEEEQDEDGRDEDGDMEMADELFGMDVANVGTAGALQAPGLETITSAPGVVVGEDEEEDEEAVHDDLFDGDDDEVDMQEVEDSTNSQPLNMDALNGLQPIANGGPAAGDKRRLDEEDDDYDA